MIEIKNFRQAFEMYKVGTLPLNLLQDQASAIMGDTERYAETADIEMEALERLYNDPENSVADYGNYLGGNVYVCETLEDLKQVEGCDLDFADRNGDRWPNITDMPLEGDCCCYVHSEPRFIMFLLCWNNAGGPVYYIPQHLWTDNVIQSVHQTESFWEHCNDHLKEK
jgi:hypothetical protein